MAKLGVCYTETDEPTDLKHQKESSMFRRIPWQEVCKFLAGGFFVNAGILFYLCLNQIITDFNAAHFLSQAEQSCGGAYVDRATWRSCKDPRVFLGSNLIFQDYSGGTAQHSDLKDDAG
jgi:hypothetical protein